MNSVKTLSIVVVASLSIGYGWTLRAQTASPNVISNNRGATVTKQATGTFDVKLSPLLQYNTSEDAKLARMSIDKQFHGDLEATSKGEMLSAGTDVKGSAGYVAIERVSGSLLGRIGSFVFQHNATMTRGAPYQNIIVVPDSGTGELTGLSGNMRINIADGKHSYEFEFTLPGGT